MFVLAYVKLRRETCRANLINFRACIFYFSDSIEDGTALERNVQRHGDGEFSTPVSVFFFFFFLIYLFIFLPSLFITVSSDSFVTTCLNRCMIRFPVHSNFK